jgi:hypothetical protein
MTLGKSVSEFLTDLKLHDFEDAFKEIVGLDDLEDVVEFVEEEADLQTLVDIHGMRNLQKRVLWMAIADLREKLQLDRHAQDFGSSRRRSSLGKLAETCKDKLGQWRAANRRLSKSHSSVPVGNALEADIQTSKGILNTLKARFRRPSMASTIASASSTSINGRRGSMASTSSSEAADGLLRTSIATSEDEYQSAISRLSSTQSLTSCMQILSTSSQDSISQHCSNQSSSSLQREAADSIERSVPQNRKCRRAMTAPGQNGQNASCSSKVKRHNSLSVELGHLDRRRGLLRHSSDSLTDSATYRASLLRRAASAIEISAPSSSPPLSANERRSIWLDAMQKDDAFC